MIIHRHLTREEQNILDIATLKALKIIENDAAAGGDMQDGMLSYYQSQAKLSDINVEERIKREYFDYRVHGAKAKVK